MEEYLIQGKKNQGTQLILEIKPHKRVVNEDKAVATILYLVQKYQMEDQVEYISFSMNICKELIRRAPSAQVSYLRGEVSPADLKTLGFPAWIIIIKYLTNIPNGFRKPRMPA